MARLLAAQTGSLGDGYPYVRVGNGPETLLVIPGIGDAMFDGSYGRVGTLLTRRQYRHYLEEYTVYLVSRPRGLPHDATIESMAEGYAEVLESWIGPAAVMGISMGGLIAQELAKRRPGLVEQLIVGVAGCRLAPSAGPLMDDLHQLASDHQWVELRSRLLETMLTGTKGTLYPTLSRTVGRLRPPTPAVPNDVVLSAEAVDAYDGCADLDAIETGTLVIGADNDPFFPESILRETHERLPNAQLALFREAKHGVFLEQKAAFDNWVREFLAGRATPHSATA